MPYRLAIGLLLLVPAVLPAAGKKSAKKNAPIPVIQIQRKTPVSYDQDVEPILANKCFVCHTGQIKEGKFDMGSYETLMKGGKHGRPIVPGKSAESRLIRLAGKVQKPFMPPKTEEPLTPQELAILKLWVDQGAKPPTGMRRLPKVILTRLPASVHPVRALALSPTKPTLVADGRANHIHLYDAASGKYLRSLFDPSLVSPDHHPVKAAHLSIVDSLAWSPDGNLLASGAYQEVKLWDPKTGKLHQTLTGFADRVVALCFSPDRKLLATGGGPPTQDGEIKIFNVADGKLLTNIKNGHSDTVFGVSFSPDGKKLATCAADKFVKVFEVPSGKLLKTFEGHTHHVLDVGWRADGKVLASASADNTIKVWDYDKGEQIRTIEGHSKQITRLLFIGNKPEIATCSGDETVRFWNVDNGGNFRNFGGNRDFLYALGVTPDGALVASGGEEGVVRVYNGTNGALLKTLLPPEATPQKKKKK